MNRVVIVTGAGRGIGRAHALAFGAAGARVVVNDLSAAVAGEVAELIGRRAVVNTDDVGTWAGAKRLVDTAVSEFGGLDVLVNNAGIVRDRMIVSCGEDEWDEVVRVHLKGHFATLHHAAAHWRAVHKAGGAVSGRVINTSSGAGIFGSVGQANYSAAKAGIASMTLVAAAELARYGITVNAIAPAARTRMTEATFAETMAAPEDGFDAMAPENISPLVVWLGSEEAGDVTGRMFEVDGGRVCVVHGWQRGPEVDKGERWSPEELGGVVRKLVADDHPTPVYGAE
ncbi:SDR family oxidoreductase [Lentzea flaviverrucosa]|uniref:NAD(P)-dependent dehydrogenase, short-chain alcohol dehydrogenase family n=1 Tax=Lentzea flaviverrucosa TaxID=200379 RepID=A0A1H9CND1_9PSEU|nr:SDR family oxidoreductase [Lentzea flaviverrucosa]RDI24595.1 NAD(P)-dependent dehydrogenase (short-subunit alcohol dehydrogenase family) [Lentzea flaviverrucosa]SEQ02567.1 NAD(P)-dependent dehydrogenase, short-chain alcohol dehydrogenase family [Lentzea flaviverrucosa]